VWEVGGDEVRHHRVDPTELGLGRVTLADLAGGDPPANAAIFEGMLAGAGGPHRDIVLLNAGAGLVVGGVATTLGEGVEAARAALDVGRVEAKLQQLREVSRRIVSRG
jgi:anthranilate phosphoribosyltransferase